MLLTRTPDVDKTWDKKFLPKDMRERMLFTKTNRQAAKEIIMKCLGPNAVEQTYLNSNTQKNEAVNRVFGKTVPKNITFGLNTLKGRASTAVLHNNEGFQAAIIAQCHSAISHQVSVEVRQKINAIQIQRKKEKEKKKKKHVKQKRINLRSNKNKLYEKKALRTCQ